MPKRDEITKLEAARRQLDCAIRLYVHEDDLLAVQTLAWAAFNVLISYDKATNSGSAWAKAMRNTPDTWSREVANFLKHADRDADATIPCFPELLPELLLDFAARIYENLTRRRTREMEIIKFVAEARMRRHDEFEIEREWRDSILNDDEHAEQDAEDERREAGQHRARLSVARDLLTGKMPF